MIEIKFFEFIKGLEVNRFLFVIWYDFILVMGDDIMDDDMFKVLFVIVVIVKIGIVFESVCYNLFV